MILQASYLEIGVRLKIAARPFLLDPSRVSIHYAYIGLRFVSEQPPFGYLVEGDSGPPPTLSLTIRAPTAPVPEVPMTSPDSLLTPVSVYETNY